MKHTPRQGIKHTVLFRRLPDGKVWGGGERNLVDFLRNVDYRKHRVTLVLNNDVFSKVFERENIPVKVEVFNEYLQMGFLKRFRTVYGRLRALDADRVVLVQGSFWDFEAIDFLACVATTRNRLIDLHLSSPNVQQLSRPNDDSNLSTIKSAWWYGKMWRHLLKGRLSDKILCLSSEAKRRMVDWYMYPVRRIHVLYIGIDLDRFHPDSAARLQLRASLGIPAEDTVIISTARFSPEKKLERILYSFDMLQRKYSNLWLILLGEGPMLNEMKELAVTLSCASRTKYLGFRSDPLNYLRASDIFVLSSDYEGLSNAMLEAMGVGLVTVVTRVSGAEDAVLDGKSGFITECSHEGIRSGLEKALKLTEAEREAIRASAMATVRAKFESHRCTEAMVHALELD